MPQLTLNTSFTENYQIFNAETENLNNTNIPCQPSLDSIRSFEDKDLVLSYCLRHNLTNVAMSGLFKLLKLMNPQYCPDIERPHYSAENNKSLFFCNCHNYQQKVFKCSICNIVSNNYFCIPDLKANFFNIISKHFSSGCTLDITLYTDGVNTFEKSKFSIWSIYIVFNDLPFKIRYKIENILICGIWY